MNMTCERFSGMCIPEPMSGCWLWEKGMAHGYGVASSGRGKSEYAHRVAYRLFRGPIPIGTEIDHLCRNRACVNPHHLELVTSRTNTLRGKSAPALNALKSTCPRGHPYSPVRHYNGRQRRECRECLQRYWRERYYARIRALKKP